MTIPPFAAPSDPYGQAVPPPPYGQPVPPSPYGQPVPQPPYGQPGSQPFAGTPSPYAPSAPSSAPDPFYRGPVAGQQPPPGAGAAYGQSQYPGAAGGYGAQPGYGQPQFGSSPYGPPPYSPAGYGPTGYGPATYPLSNEPLNVPPIPRAKPPLDQPWYGIGLFGAFKRAFRKYATFSGRASRAEFWWFFLANFLITLGLGAGMVIAANAATGNDFMETASDFRAGGSPASLAETVSALIFVIAYLVWILGTFIPNLALFWRRLHDAGHSGAWFFLLVVAGGLGAFAPYPLGNITVLIAEVVLLIFLVQGPSEAGRMLYDRRR